MRNPRYRFSFAYVTERKSGKTFYGNLEERLVNKVDLETILRVLSPMKSGEWMRNVDSLGRNGYVIFEVNGYENDRMIKKVMRIQRN